MRSLKIPTYNKIIFIYYVTISQRPLRECNVKLNLNSVEYILNPNKNITFYNRPLANTVLISSKDYYIALSEICFDST